MNTPNPNERVSREFRVSYSTGEPPRSDQPLNNTYGLTGEGKVVFDGRALILEGTRSGFTLSGSPRIALADVANVDYNATSQAFLIRTRGGRHYVILWVASREEAEALWALLPQEKTPEFLADQAAHERFGKAMSVLGARALVSPTIIAINVAVFIVMLLAGADLMNPNPAVHIRFGSNFGPLTWTGEEWRLLTSAFLHFGLIHIALNMYALYQGGALVERLFGSTRFAVIYLLSALSGSVASGWWDPMRNSAGASGAIFGVYGALLAFLAVRREDIPPSMLKSVSSSALLFCLYSLVIGAAHPLIDNACHVGGLLGGLVSGVILARPFTTEARATPQPLRIFVAVLAIGLPLAWLAQPLMADTGSQFAALKFERELQAFGPVEGALVRKQTEILTFPPNVRVNRLEVAHRLREEVLEPWRRAIQPLLQTNTIRNDGPQLARQQAVRAYLRAREQAMTMQVNALQTGEAADQELAVAADQRVGETLRHINALESEGN